jgi:hypothetical protein
VTHFRWAGDRGAQGAGGQQDRTTDGGPLCAHAALDPRRTRYATVSRRTCTPTRTTAHAHAHSHAHKNNLTDAQPLKSERVWTTDDRHIPCGGTAFFVDVSPPTSHSAGWPPCANNKTQSHFSSSRFEIYDHFNFSAEMYRRAAAVAKMGPMSVRQAYGGHSRALATSPRGGIIDWGFYNTRSRRPEDGNEAQDQSKPTQQALSPALKSYIVSKYGQEHAPAIIAR